MSKMGISIIKVLRLKEDRSGRNDDTVKIVLVDGKMLNPFMEML